MTWLKQSPLQAILSLKSWGENSVKAAKSFQVTHIRKTNYETQGALHSTSIRTKSELHFSCVTGYQKESRNMEEIQGNARLK